MADIVTQKILAAVLIVCLSLGFGFLPLALAKKYDLSSIDTLDPVVMKREKKKLKNAALSFLLNLGGGVLIANCFCHWLPEVREGIEGTNIDTFLPLAEVIMCSGFFFICALEELLHHFLHPHQAQSVKLETITSKETNLSNGCDPGRESGDNCADHDKSSEKTQAQIKAAIRTVFVVMALSFHSTIEGLALALEDDGPGIWLNTGATALHKFVISFSVGMELVSNKVTVLMYCISIIVFSLAPALGSTIGIILTEMSLESSSIDLPLQILQGVATGTIVYVVFFEIIPKAKTVGGTGKQHILAMILGFAIFLPSLYFHHDEHHDSDSTSSPCTTTLSPKDVPFPSLVQSHH